MPSPVFDASYRHVKAFYEAAAAVPHRARIYRQYVQQLSGNSFSVLFRAHVEEILAKNDTPAVFVVNMSGFGAVNDTYGHNSGDQFLIQTETHIQQFFRRQGLSAAISRSGINFVVVVKGLRNGAARQALAGLQTHLASPECAYNVRVETKYVIRDGGIREEVQRRFSSIWGTHAVDIRKAPLFNSRQRKRVSFPTFCVGLIEGGAGFSASSYQEAANRAMVSLNIRSKDPSQPPVHVYQVVDLTEPRVEVPLFVTREEIEVFQGLIQQEGEATRIWQRSEAAAGLFATLLFWLNVDSRTGAPTRNAFETKLAEVYAAKTPHTLTSIDINGFGSFNATFNSESSVLGMLLGDHAVTVLCKLLNETFTGVGVSATVYRTGGDELHILTTENPMALEAVLHRVLPAKLAAAAHKPDLEFKIAEAKVSPEMRLKLAAQGIRPKEGIYSINIFTLERKSPKYGDKIFTGFSLSLGVIRISDFGRPAHEYVKDADNMAECAKSQKGEIGIYYDDRTNEADRRADKRAGSGGRRYVNGG